MVRLRHFEEDKNVLDAARERIDRTLDGCDRIAVAFSGGKDSLAVLHLVRERMQARGDDRPVATIYRDMEYVNSSVTSKVEETFALPWIDGKWFCLQRSASTNVAGTPLDFITWQPGRASYRTMPPGAISDPGTLYDEPAYDRLTASLWPGRVIIATGLRAAESLIRYRAIANKLSEPWLSKSKAEGITLCRPVYDWLELDVLRYLYDVGAAPAAIYDAQAWAGQGQLRTASLLANEQMRDLTMLKVTDPDAYAALLDLAPDVGTAERYDRDLKDRHAIGEKPATSYLGVRQWIKRKYSDYPHAERKALDRLNFALSLAHKNPDGFPPWWIQHEIARDGHGLGMMPIAREDPRYGKARP